MGVRLRDVAEHAGVSVKTVSNVVHGYVHVAPATRQRVQDALDELNYRPNLSARSLRRGRSGVIALALPALDMPYFAELTRFVVQAAEARGWTVLIDQTDGLREREQVVAAGVRSHLIDGLILSPVALGVNELTRSRDETPVVLLGERIGGGAIDHVAIDNVAAARTAIEHLLDLGRRRIAVIGYQARPASDSGVAALRRRGYEETLAAHGIEVDDRLTIEVGGFGRQDGAGAMRELLSLKQPPDAVFCFNDLLALGALRRMSEEGVRAPDDIAVIGLDNIEDGQFSTPTLSTVAPDKETIAFRAVEMLHERLAPESTRPPRDVRVGFELIARESTLGR